MEQIIDIEPPVVPRSFRQLGILVLDGSGSMGSRADGPLQITKADAVNMAVREMFSRFKVSRKAPNFTFSVISFTDSAAGILAPTDVEDIDDNADFNPMTRGGGGTYIGSGLDAARQVADSFLREASDGLPVSVVVLVMSDGECGMPNETTRSADALKADPRVTLATTFFATKGQRQSGQDLLKAISTDPAKFYKTVYDAETLRAFFMASMTAAATRVMGELMPASDR